MKELSIEEKAKAYDDAIDKIKYVMGHGVSPTLNKEDLQDIFPELKEGEDDKVRKKLIHLVKKSHEQGGYALHKWEADEMLAWLEKQGEQKHETPIPRFNIGDWVIVHNKDAYQVIGQNTYDYRLQHYLGGKMNYPFKYEPDLKPWTIQDAKDGDVLYSECLRILWIFKGRGTVYCGCNLNYNDGAFCGEGYIETPTDVIPATKEQRDFLFEKMKEAGYEMGC